MTEEMEAADFAEKDSLLDAMRCGMVRYGSIRFDAMRCDVIRSGTIEVWLRPGLSPLAEFLSRNETWELDRCCSGVSVIWMVE